MQSSTPQALVLAFSALCCGAEGEAWQALARHESDRDPTEQDWQLSSDRVHTGGGHAHNDGVNDMQFAASREGTRNPKRIIA